MHTEYSFDPNTLRLARQVTTTPTRIIQDLNYGYDKVGNVLTMANNADGPQPNLLGGQSNQTFAYDNYYRLVSASGGAPLASGKHRDFTYAVVYDASSNIASKNQEDVISGVSSTGALTNPQQTQNNTSYNWSFTYKPAGGPGTHQLATAGGNSYTYDANGNFTQVADSKNRVQRTVTWDAANRARNINDASGRRREVDELSVTRNVAYRTDVQAAPAFYVQRAVALNRRASAVDQPTREHNLHNVVSIISRGMSNHPGWRGRNRTQHCCQATRQRLTRADVLTTRSTSFRSRPVS